MAVAALLPDLDSPYPLSEEHLSYYREHGHIMLPGLALQDEVRVFQPIFSEAVADRARNVAPMEKRDTYGRAFLQIMNLWREEERLKRFVFAQRFARVAAELMGVDAVRLYHDQALYKEGGGGHTPWHQDQHYWPLDTNNTITMWMPLVDVSEAMGTMHFASGSHKLGYLGDMPISDESEKQWNTLIQERGFTRENHGAMKAGDATFHSGWTLHGATGNSSTTTREVMTIIYFADGTKVGRVDNKNRQNDLDAWLPGGVEGELAASPLNPVLYRKS
jgi:ectoine hydroxylase-related dioxygenase (phytanoyl-CoA dioxygenase family)